MQLLLFLKLLFHLLCLALHSHDLEIDLVPVQATGLLRTSPLFQNVFNDYIPEFDFCVFLVCLCKVLLCQLDLLLLMLEK
jgi:hypothetical protein